MDEVCDCPLHDIDEPRRFLVESAIGGVTGGLPGLFLAPLVSRYDFARSVLGQVPFMFIGGTRAWALEIAHGMAVAARQDGLVKRIDQMSDSLETELRAHLSAYFAEPKNKAFWAKVQKCPKHSKGIK